MQGAHKYARPSVQVHLSRKEQERPLVKLIAGCLGAPPSFTADVDTAIGHPLCESNQICSRIFVHVWLYCHLSYREMLSLQRFYS